VTTQRKGTISPYTGLGIGIVAVPYENDRSLDERNAVRTSLRVMWRAVHILRCQQKSWENTPWDMRWWAKMSSGWRCGSYIISPPRR